MTAMATDRTPRDRKPFQVRLPRFVTEQEIGLGDAVSHVARAMRVRPCGDCSRRAAAMNRWVVLMGRKP
ncbi:hypothetical protein [Elioraea sp.]|uniref:hypothetical protein n=1 Tax=Elioraea sp. TaxID=2185103 RepID=UPI0025BAC74C|nr:hypothetical protein [Elioraea sp.]